MMTLEKVEELKRWLSAEIVVNKSCNAVHKVPWFGWRASLEPIIDSIESEASELVEESEAFAKRVQEAVESHEDVTLFGVDYTPLPVDADGKPWHVGDVIEWDDGINAEVIAIGGSTLYYTDEVGIVDWTQAASKRHHRELTVENVLREFAEKITDSQIPSVHPTYEEAIAEYAEKLQLTDDYTEHVRGK